MSEQRADDLPSNADSRTKEEARRLASLLLELADEGITLTINAKETPSPRLASTRRHSPLARRGGWRVTGSSKSKPSNDDESDESVPSAEVEALRARIHAKRKTLTKHGL